jgi:nicotinamide mononucleotide transporter
MIEWLNNNWIEVVGAGMTLIFLYLEVTRKWTMWIVGIISGLFYVYINFDQQLYAMMGLRSYDVFVSIYGLYCWKFAKSKDNSALPFRFIDKTLTLKLIGIGIAVYAALWFIVIHFTDMPNPLTAGVNPVPFFIELLAVTLSILATWMAAKKIVESWYLWMIVNPCTITLYVFKGMYPSTILYIVFAIFSVIGYIQWRKIAIQQK